MLVRRRLKIQIWNSLINMIILHVMEIRRLNRKLIQRFEIKISVYFLKYYAKYCQRLYIFYVDEQIKFWAS
jgi:hypothetical protein